MAHIMSLHILGQTSFMWPPNCQGGWEMSSGLERGRYGEHEPVLPAVVVVMSTAAVFVTFRPEVGHFRFS